MRTLSDFEHRFQIRAATESDAVALCRIYNPYVTDTVVTFEEAPVSIPVMQARIATTLLDFPWLVAEDAKDRRILGYAYAGRWKGRAAYRYAVESTIYVAPQALGQGVGSALYRVLLPKLREGRHHTVIAGIALPNPASVALHEKFGFQKVAHFREVGYKLGSWVDVGYWELVLPNDPSEIVGPADP